MWKTLGLIGLSLSIVACGEKPTPAAFVPTVKTYAVEARNVALFKEYIGEIYGAKDIAIRARVEGFIKSIHFKEGLKVTKGQLLYKIESNTYDAKVSEKQSQLAAANTTMTHALNELNRYKPLAAKNAVSKSDLDAAVANYEASKSHVKAAKAQLQAAKIDLSYTQIKSPIEGVIGKTLYKVGDLVGSSFGDSEINTVSEISTIRVEFFLPEDRYLHVMRRFLKTDKKLLGKKSEDARTLEIYLSDNTKYDHFGTVDFIDRNIDVSTGSIRIQATFPNPDNILRPGLFARIRGKVQDLKDAIVIPQRCVAELQGKYQVAVVSSDGTVSIKKVTTGEKLGSFWLITEGLAPGEKIVYEGLQKVGNGSKVKGELVPVTFNYDVK